MKFGMYWLLIKDSSYCSKVVSPIYTYTSQATAGWPGKTSPRNLPGPLALIPRACISFTRRFFADQPQKTLIWLGWKTQVRWVWWKESCDVHVDCLVDDVFLSSRWMLHHLKLLLRLRCRYIGEYQLYLARCLFCMNCLFLVILRTIFQPLVLLLFLQMNQPAKRLVAQKRCH